MRLILRVWRQDNADDPGRFETHQLDEVSEDSSFLEMLDQLNEQLLEEGIEPVVFDHDCHSRFCLVTAVAVVAAEKYGVFFSSFYRALVYPRFLY